MIEKSVDERLAFFAERELNPHYRRMFTDAQAELASRQQRITEAERLLRLSWIVPSCDFDLEREVIAFIDPDGLGIRTPIRTPDQPDAAHHDLCASHYWNYTHKAQAAMQAAGEWPPACNCRTTPDPQSAVQFDLIAHLHRQRDWSERTFGPGTRLHGVCDHIRKELAEIEADPTDISEWIDVTLLALDGAWRAGHSPEQIAAALAAKQAKNESRRWPDWRTAEPGKAIEHDRSADPQSESRDG